MLYNSVKTASHSMLAACIGACLAIVILPHNDVPQCMQWKVACASTAILVQHVLTLIITYIFSFMTYQPCGLLAEHLLECVLCRCQVSSWVDHVHC